jgi:hypothetical protein
LNEAKFDVSGHGYLDMVFCTWYSEILTAPSMFVDPGKYYWIEQSILSSKSENKNLKRRWMSIVSHGYN